MPAGSRGARGLAEIVRRFRRVRIAVVGDLIADEFIYGQVARVSREAPVLILQYAATEVVPGGAGNAASNAAALGARVRVVGVVGRDASGARLVKALASRADVGSIARVTSQATPVKTRILAGGEHSAKQQIVRIDRATGAPRESTRRHAAAALARALETVDAVIVSDYGAGFVSPSMVRTALEVSAPRRGRRRAPLVFVDSRYRMLEYAGVTAVTPNESEVEAQRGVTIGDDLAALERAGRLLLVRLRAQAVLVTRGSRGMALFQPTAPTVHLPIVGSDEIADVTGAGDTVIATFALAAAAGATFADAARLANHAGGIVVMKRGTATVSAKELIASVRAAAGR